MSNDVRDDTPNKHRHSPSLVEEDEDGDLTDMLGELRILLPTAQLLSAFLITVPFAPGFANIVQTEKQVFFATFLLAVASLVMFCGPAVQHRLMRPLQQRERFKTFASRQMLVGATLLGTALVLATQLVLSEALGRTIGNVAAVIIAVLIVSIWLVVPCIWKSRKDV
ncbi:DUF6328 family protein [Chitinimonas lacunae]|uniref:DUF6328 family protein n=1 Tax=Chitinimonas lacunae TaxID=1963018 RepID=A0ABV8MTL2_9NEIS